MPQSSKQLIIAVVEDDPRIGELIREEICDEGHVFQGFITAESFLEEVNELKPDLVLLDLMLPGIDGLECLQRLRQIPSMLRCLVVVVTALNDTENAMNHNSLGPLITFSSLICLINFPNCLHPWRRNPWNREDNRQAGGIVCRRPTTRHLSFPSLHQLTHNGKLQVSPIG